MNAALDAAAPAWKKISTIPRAKLWLFGRLFLALAVLLATFLKFVVIPAAASRVLEFVQARYAPEITAGGWSGSVINLSATAHDLKVAIDGLYDRDDLLVVDELEVDLSLAHRIFHGSWIKSVTARNSRLYLERNLSGATNWSDVIDARSLANAQDAVSGTLLAQATRVDPSGLVVAADSPRFSVPRLKIEGLTVEWVEKVPSRSGGGVIREEKATLFIDDVQISATQLAGLFDGRELPSRFQLEGRIADGRISLQTQANFFSWAQQPQEASLAGGPAPRRPAIGWSPALNGTLYLENIGAASLARLVPRAVLQPTDGRLTGSVTFELALRQV